jgi:deoxyribonuclease-4
MLAQEMKRADLIGADFVVLHTGSARDGHGPGRAVSGIKAALGRERFMAGLLIENTSGKRGDIASNMAELAGIIKGSDGLVAGVCLDTCHAFASGYDIAGDDGLDRLALEVEEHVGSDMIRLLHLNDSKTPAGSGSDRHEHIGLGRIGFDALRRLLMHGLFADMPIVLETPKEKDSDDMDNLERVREMLSE